MSIWNAILFGIVQGITEFIPVSSSAHLSVMFNLFGITGAGFNSKMFSVFLHFGTVLAAVITYWRDFGEVIFQTFDVAAEVSSGNADSGRGGKNGGKGGGKTRKVYPGARTLVMMFFASIPLAMILPISGKLNSLYESSLIIGIMLILSGTVLYIAGQFREGKKSAGTMTISDAIIIGLCQCASAIPGLSRTGVVMTAGMATGIRAEFAAKFAVMMSVPVMFIANFVRIVDAASGGFAIAELPACLVGMAVALVSGYFALKVFIKAVRKRNFHWFSYYSWVAGVIFIILTMIF